MARGGYYHGDEYIPYGSSSKHKYAKKTVHNSGTYNKSKSNNKSTYKPKSNYKSHYSKTNTQNRKRQYNTTSNNSYTNQRYKKRQQPYRVISVEEANRRIKKNKKSKSTSNSDDSGWIMALLCICAILAIFISFAIDMPIAFFFILLGLWGICMVIFWIVEELPKKIKSSFKKNNKTHYHPYPFKGDTTLDHKICPKCGRKYDKDIKQCSYCGYKFK